MASLNAALVAPLTAVLADVPAVVNAADAVLFALASDVAPQMPILTQVTDTLPKVNSLTNQIIVDLKTVVVDNNQKVAPVITLKKVLEESLGLAFESLTTVPVLTTTMNTIFSVIKKAVPSLLTDLTKLIRIDQDAASIVRVVSAVSVPVRTLVWAVNSAAVAASDALADFAAFVGPVIEAVYALVVWLTAVVKFVVQFFAQIATVVPGLSAADKEALKAAIFAVTYTLDSLDGVIAKITATPNGDGSAILAAIAIRLSTIFNSLSENSIVAQLLANEADAED